MAIPAEIIAFIIDEIKTKKAVTIKILSSVLELNLFINKIISRD